MNKVLIVGLCLLFSSCSSTEKRTRYSDKNMRLMIDSANISAANYARIQTALVQQEMWTVLDRASGLRAIKKEQEELHRVSSDRYRDSEKYAIWSRLYGAGAVLVPFAQCAPKTTFWHSTPQTYCSLFPQKISQCNSNKI